MGYYDGTVYDIMLNDRGSGFKGLCLSDDVL